MSHKGNVAGLVVTYNPNLIKLAENIKTLEKNVGGHYVVVDNGSQNLKKISKLVKKGYLLKLNHNLGIAYAQNKGFAFLSQQKYSWAILLDQDSVLPSNAADLICETKEFSQEDTGIIGLSIDKKAPKQGVIERKDLISSGCFVRTDAWARSGGMDDDLFIDFVDFDFDAKVLMAGYRLYQDTDILMQHEIGDTVYSPILGKVLHLGYRGGYFSDHSPIRLFYFYRNSLIINRRYPDFLNLDYNLVFKHIKRTREIFTYKKPRFKKFVFAFKGILAGAKYNPNSDKKFQSSLERIHGQN